MRRWAVATVSLYLFALLALTVPVILIAFAGASGVKFHAAIRIFADWGYWLWLAVLVACQALLLLLPLKITERRFIPRRTLVVPCIVTAFLLANLFVAGLVDLLCAAFDEKWVTAFTYLIPFETDPQNPSLREVVIMAVVTLLVFWVVWTIIFRHYADSDDPESLLKRFTRWLLAGSILELLVAVPSHIIVRRRDDCCAPIGTFWGITSGLAIMLLAFGPGVFFLFKKRFQQLQPKPKWEEQPL